MSTKQIITVFVIYIVFISLIAFVMTVADKINAGKGRRRVSEKSLFLVAFFGGSLCEYLTMKAIRHKTRHKRFMLGLPAIMLFQVAAAVAIYCFLFPHAP